MTWRWAFEQQWGLMRSYCLGLVPSRDSSPCSLSVMSGHSQDRWRIPYWKKKTGTTSVSDFGILGALNICINIVRDLGKHKIRLFSYTLNSHTLKLILHRTFNDFVKIFQFSMMWFWGLLIWRFGIRGAQPVASSLLTSMRLLTKKPTTWCWASSLLNHKIHVCWATEAETILYSRRT